MDRTENGLPSRPPFFPRVLDDLLAVRCEPDRSTVVALGTYLLVVAAHLTAFRLLTPARAAAHFVTFGLITLAGLGVLFPVFYTVMVRRRPLSDLGIGTHLLLPSLLLSLLVSLDSYRKTLVTLQPAWTPELAPLVTAALAVGLFEAIFFAGWLQLRFEAAFGLVPGLVLTALGYSLYHLGYGVPPEEIGAVFGVGLFFGALFRVTKNVAVLWPFYTPIDGLCSTLCADLRLPLVATYGFGFVLTLMVGAVAVALSVSRRREAAGWPGASPRR